MKFSAKPEDFFEHIEDGDIMTGLFRSEIRHLLPNFQNITHYKIQCNHNTLFLPNFYRHNGSKRRFKIESWANGWSFDPSFWAYRLLSKIYNSTFCVDSSCTAFLKECVCEGSQKRVSLFETLSLSTEKSELGWKSAWACLKDSPVRWIVLDLRNMQV